ncbi:MerR family transcriptional regulator [Chryseobacterium sp. P1-3]|uniref:MerR family transcriptional regulator n=1 Tax=Chryseobacterium gallinarum TaxID=1324352 RepID=A0A0G3M0M5_CHRGL|nr:MULTISPECIES: chaperone modulator CbpM [Chryseobacterium]AKK71518.1 MerR family transcriptional regulator [Chryseobacterium gallinarum]KFF75472.1 MerR family transcriptional regulator [Chryseobacterium sp. P1-3]MCL8538822.1 chaperone modulator CbpM [Chryseobacterium gallinarum]QIY89228.1 MerR family transcriptional regulator [Chryseobacterium gallinarum]
MSERISREELVRIYNIEVTFFDELVDYGLLHVQTEDNIRYLMYEDLPELEKFANWYYDLEINLPGLEVIHNMLKKLEALKRRNRELMNKLSAINNEYEDI